MGTYGICSICRRRPPLMGLGECAGCHEYRRLLEEDLTLCPPRLSALDFQKLMKKVAVHAHATRLPDAKEATVEEVELRLTEVVLNALPLFYVSLMPYDRETARKKGLRGSYTFKTKIPRAVVYEALEATEIWRRQDPDDPVGA